MGGPRQSSTELNQKPQQSFRLVTEQVLQPASLFVGNHGGRGGEICDRIFGEKDVAGVGYERVEDQATLNRNKKKSRQKLMMSPRYEEKITSCKYINLRLRIF